MFSSPRQWWKFAITAQLETIHDRNSRHTVDFLVTRVRDINMYAEAFTEYLALDPRYLDDELKVIAIAIGTSDLVTFAIGSHCTVS